MLLHNLDNYVRAALQHNSTILSTDDWSHSAYRQGQSWHC